MLRQPGYRSGAQVKDALRDAVFVSPDRRKRLAADLEKEMTRFGYPPSHVSDASFVSDTADGPHDTFVATTSSGPLRFSVAPHADQSLAPK